MRHAHATLGADSSQVHLLVSVQPECIVVVVVVVIAAVIVFPVKTAS